VLAGSLLTDLLALKALQDAIGAIEAARVHVTTGDRAAMKVEVSMALRCLREAQEIE
jgi:hypothetical protein